MKTCSRPKERGVGYVLVLSMLVLCTLSTSAWSWTPQSYDGQWQTYGGGWNYIWYSISNTAYWAYNNTTVNSARFAYQYGNGQWWNSDLHHYWSPIGPTGMSSTFIGDGLYHPISGTSWSYAYYLPDNAGYWNTTSDAALRFVYHYANGQWYDMDFTTNTWDSLGNSNTGAAFIGDGAYHPISGLWSYAYHLPGNSGYWETTSDAALRFVYHYANGQWYDMDFTTNTWDTLGNSNIAAAFIGDGAYHPINGSWSYAYHLPGNSGYWETTSDAALRFVYHYANGQWYDMDFTTQGWDTLGSSSIGAAFIGDGAYHPINSSWSYAYVTSVDTDYWLNRGTGLLDFAYTYHSGQWWDRFGGGAWDWHYLGSPSQGAAFIGDGIIHNMGSVSFLWADSTYLQTNAAGQWTFLVDPNATVWLNLPSGVTPDSSWSPWRVAADVYPSSGSSQFTVFNGDLYFDANDGVHGFQLWEYDGSHATMITNVTGGLDPNYLTVFGNALYFSGHDGSPNGYVQLWKYDGTQATIIATHIYGLFPSELVVFNNSLYFNGNNIYYPGWSELWKYDGTQSTMVTSGWNFNPQSLTVFNNALCFASGGQLWEYDGTQATQLTNITSLIRYGMMTSPWPLNPQSLTVFNNALYFKGWNSNGWQLWKYDGNQATQLTSFPDVEYIDMGPYHILSSYEDMGPLTVFNNALYVVAYGYDANYIGGYRVWKYDGGGVTQVTQIDNLGLNVRFSVFNGNLYFSDTTSGRSWVYDGTSYASINALMYGPWFSYNGHAYTVGFDIQNGAVLWQWL